MSRFVAADGSAPTEEDEAWKKAQAAIEATRTRPRVEAGSQEGGKSLYETLQANKAAKQEAFEESIRLTNQFRSLDEDEVEFLDSVLESTRAQEAAVKKENREQLEAFRKQQEEAERAAKTAETTEAAENTEQSTWTVGRKRKKGKDTALGSLKLRKSSTTEKDTSVQMESTRVEAAAEASVSPKPSSPQKSPPTKTGPNLDVAATTGHIKSPDSSSVRTTPPKAISHAPPVSLGLGLGAYSSDEDEDG